MRIDVLRSKVKSGEYTLKPGYPPIESIGRGRRFSITLNLECVEDYFRENASVAEVADGLGVTECRVRNRLRAGVKFLMAKGWLVPVVSREKPKSVKRANG